MIGERPGDAIRLLDGLHGDVVSASDGPYIDHVLRRLRRDYTVMCIKWGRQAFERLLNTAG